MFIKALCDDFDKHGVVALRRVREEDPSTYARVVAGILPKEIEIKRPLSDLSEDELLRAIELIRLALGSGPVIDGTGTETAESGEQAGGLPAIRETTGIPPRWQ
jgi:hypothetical protein